MLFSIHPSGVIRGGYCGDCHGGNQQTNRPFSNNGLDPDAAPLVCGSKWFE